METPKKTEAWSPDASAYSTPAQLNSSYNGAPTNGNIAEKTTVWNWISLLFLAIIFSNSIFCTFLLCHVTFTTQETKSSLLLVSTQVDSVLQTLNSSPYFVPQVQAKSKQSTADTKNVWSEPEAETVEKV